MIRKQNDIRQMVCRCARSRCRREGQGVTRIAVGLRGRCRLRQQQGVEAPYPNLE